jgi:two-component system, NtrC family, sensor kinase
VRRLGPSLPRVEVDPNLVHQVFLNILVNARQAMPHGGRLTVESRVHGSNSHRRSVEVLISDTGIGIDHDDLNRIFQPFFTTKSQGTGLGLAIAARVIEQHAGRITVDSTVGEGTTFTVVLPASPVGARHGE